MINLGTRKKWRLNGRGVEFNADIEVLKNIND